MHQIDTGGESSQPQPQRKSFVAFLGNSSPFDVQTFPWSFALCSIGAVVAAHHLAHELLDLVSTRWSAITIAIVGLAAIVVLLAIAVHLWTSRFHAHRSRAWRETLGIAVLLFLLDFAVLAIQKGIPHFGWIALVALVGGLLALVFYAIRQREHLTRVKALQAYPWLSTNEARERASGRSIHELPSATHLIILYSEPNFDLEFDRSGDATRSCTFRGRKERSGSTATVTPSMSIAEAIAQLQSLGPNWQQLLRGVEPHLDTVQSVTIIGSVADSAGALQELLRLFVPGTVSIHTSDPIAFDDVRALTDKVIALVHAIIADDPNAHVVIETTGGYKTTSIAGAVATLNTNAMFQYVNTNAPWTVWLHDLRIDGPPEV